MPTQLHPRNPWGSFVSTWSHPTPSSAVFCLLLRPAARAYSSGDADKSAAQRDAGEAERFHSPTAAFSGPRCCRGHTERRSFQVRLHRHCLQRYFSRLPRTCSAPTYAASVISGTHLEWIPESLLEHCCSGSVELVNRGKIEFNYHTAFGVAALAPLASGHALVLILAGEKVRCRHPHASAHDPQGPARSHCCPRFRWPPQLKGRRVDTSGIAEWWGERVEGAVRRWGWCGITWCGNWPSRRWSWTESRSLPP